MMSLNNTTTDKVGNRLNETKGEIIVKKIFYLQIITILLIVTGCSTNHKELKASNKHFDDYYLYNPKADIKDFQFFNDKNGLVVEWKFDENEQKESLSATGNVERIRANSNFLIRQRERVRDLTANKKMKSDEYFYLDIYDLKNKKLSKKEVNLWKILVDYIGNDDFELVSTLPTIQKINGNDYSIIKTQKQKKYHFFILNLKTLKIDGEKTEQELKEKNRVYLTISTSDSGDAGVYPYDNSFWKDKSYKGNINLKESNLTAFELFSKPDAFAYKVINSENGAITNGKELIDLETGFLKQGVSVYDHAHLPGKFSIEGKETKISHFDDVQKYYNGLLDPN